MTPRSRCLLLSFCLVLIASISGGRVTADDGDASNRPQNSEVELEPGSSGVIGCSLLASNIPYFVTIGEHIAEEGAEHGFSTTLLYCDLDATVQVSQVRQFISEDVSAIVISPCDIAAIVPAVREANDAGIPVFTVDIPCDDEGIETVCHVSIDNELGGRLAAEAMIKALGPEGGDVGILHYELAESCRVRVKGFTDAVNEYNASAHARIEIVSTMNGDGSRATGHDVAQDMLARQPSLRGIFCINDPSALGAASAIEEAGRDDIAVIGFDGQRDAREAIRSGRMHASLRLHPDKMGTEVVRQIVAHLAGEEVPDEILVPPTLYTQEIAEMDTELE